MSKQITFFHRQNNSVETEKVYGDGAVKFLYESTLGKALSPLLTQKWISDLYGVTQDTPLSGRKVPGFIKQYDIDLNEYQAGSLQAHNKEDSYASFNEFFIRRFNDGERHFCANDKLAAPAEARYFGFEKIDDNISYPVKGKFLSPTDMIAKSEHANTFKNGPLFIARLCPVDYHRYHYPDDGRTIDAYPVHGPYHSVNPLALQNKEDILVTNERRVAILDTDNFGKLAYIEVGAICVGTIVQSFDETQRFKRGDEKGYFLFGGSTVIVIGEEGKWRPSDDILQHSAEGREVYLKLGDEVGLKA